LEVVLGW